MAFYEERLTDRMRTYECQEHGFFTFTCHRPSAPQAVERRRRLIELYASLRNSGVLTIHGRGYPSTRPLVR